MILMEILQNGMEHMRPKKQIDVGQQDLFRNRLDQIIDLNHPLSRLTKLMDWERLHKEFSPYYSDIGRAGLPIRLMIGLNLLKHTMLFPMRRSVRAGLKILISNTFAVKFSFNIAFPLSARV